MTHEKPTILEAAKQGNPAAIAALMNRQLQAKGITAKAALKDECLRVLLEAEQAPDEKELTGFIRRGMEGLKAVSICKVIVFGKQLKEDVPIWSQEFELSFEPQVYHPVKLNPQENTQAAAPALEPEIRCPKCQSSQILASKKGFGVGKAVAGVVLLGPLGLAGGLLGSNKVLVSCVNCGHQWEPKNT